MGVPQYKHQPLKDGRKKATISRSDGTVLGSGEGQENHLVRKI